MPVIDTDQKEDTITTIREYIGVSSNGTGKYYSIRLLIPDATMQNVIKYCEISAVRCKTGLNTSFTDDFQIKFNS